MAKKLKRMHRARKVVTVLQLALTVGDGRSRKKAVKLAGEFLEQTDNDLGTFLPWKPPHFADSPEQQLAWNLSNVDYHDCGDSVKAERRFNLIQAYVHENYREIKLPDPWWHELAMSFLRGVVMALGACIVLGFFCLLLAGEL